MSTWTLKELTKALASEPVGNTVALMFTTQHITGLASWRGRYDEMSIEFSDWGKPMTVGELLAQARAADGGIFEGYKGGDYQMHEWTPVWVCEHGDADERGLLGIRRKSGVSILITSEDVPGLIAELDGSQSNLALRA
jgi:hypothetical protein